MRQLTDGTRQLTLAQAYEPFGNPRLAAGQDTTPYAFTGEWTDGAGLVHLRARYYQPEVGRFFQVDPWRGDLDRPQSLSPYAYVGNNPLTLSDPSGRCYPPLQWLRHVPPDDVLCEYMDMAAFITGAPMATPGEKNLARIYIGGWALAHSLLIVAAGFYAAGTAIAAAEIAPAIGTWALEGIIGAKTFGEATTLIATTLASSSFLQAIGIGGEAYLTYQAEACGNEDAAAILISGFLLTGQSLVQNGLQRGVSRILGQFSGALNPTGRVIASSTPGSHQEAEVILGDDLGLPQNTRRFYSDDYGLEISTYRSPDFEGPDFFADSKLYRASSLTSSSQLRDYVTIAMAEGKELWIYVAVNTHVTEGAINLVSQTGGSIVNYFP